MSRNSGASGNVTLPKKAYTEFSKFLTEKYNELAANDYVLFNEFIEIVLAKNKGKRDVKWYDSICSIYEDKYNHLIQNYNSHPLLKVIDFYTLAYTVSHDATNSNIRPKKLKFIKIKSSSPAVYFLFNHDDYISLDKKEHSVHLHICYNNHSVEEANKNIFYRTFIEKLKKVEWTRKSGGIIYLYQEEDEYCNGTNQSCNIMMSFGPPVFKKKIK